MGLIMIWHEVFTTGEYIFKTRKEAIAARLDGWGCCCTIKLEKIPAKFGLGMVFIGKYLGEGVDANNLHKLANGILNE